MGEESNLVRKKKKAEKKKNPPNRQRRSVEESVSGYGAGGPPTKRSPHCAALDLCQWDTVSSGEKSNVITSKTNNRKWLLISDFLQGIVLWQTDRSFIFHVVPDTL